MLSFSAMERAVALFKNATFIMDRGYDDNKMFLKLDSLKQDYVIRLTAKRKLLYHNKLVFATNKEIKSKDDVITIAKLYFSRWRIEEYMHDIPGSHFHEARNECP